jgi:hypothetical protein
MQVLISAVTVPASSRALALLTLIHLRHLSNGHLPLKSTDEDKNSSG